MEIEKKAFVRSVSFALLKLAEWRSALNCFTNLFWKTQKIAFEVKCV